jgi:AGCS family alanine or glycine:cation symporter
MIFKYAFTPNAIIGGGIGVALKTAISQGAKRGLFSNEAGMGSTPHAHAQAKVNTPHEQGTVAMAGVFLDTFVVLTMTALIVISTLYAGDGMLSSPEKLQVALEGGVNKNNLVKNAIASVFSGTDVGLTIGGIFIAICLFFFAFSTILGWNLFGKINFEYLFGKKSSLVYMIIAVLFVFLGSIFQNDLVWELTDFFNYLMVLPNVLALFALSKVVVNELKENGVLFTEYKEAQPVKSNLVKALCLHICHDCNLSCKYCFDALWRSYKTIFKSCNYSSKYFACNFLYIGI